MIPLDVISRHAAAMPSKVAVADDATRLTWAELEAATRAVRAWLTHALDADREHRAVVIGRNRPETAVAAAALTSLGVPWVGIDPSRDAATVEAQFGAVDPTIAVADSWLPSLPASWRETWGRSAVLLDLAPDAAASPTVTPFAVAAEPGRPDAEWRRPPFLALGFTSGSTGVPKLFVRRSKTENQRVGYLHDAFDFGPADTFLVSSPLAHASGHVWAGAALALGGSIRLVEPDPAGVVRTVARERLTGAFFVPPFLEEVVAEATGPAAGEDLTSLRFLLTGGRHVTPRTIRRVTERFGPILHLYYATTETGINTMAGPNELRAEPYSAGRPMPGVRIRALDPATRGPLPAGQVGLLAINSRFNMDEYVHRESDMVELDGERYIVTSDFGRLDAFGRLFFTGRSDPHAGPGAIDVVRMESDVEDVPGVRDGCVVRHGAGEQVLVVAAVVLEPGAERASALREAERAARRHVPGAVVVAVDRIPYNTAGKVDQRQLRAALESALPVPVAR
ncbi:MAG TPA: class I adenylate-forming enzyme family protein [Candidatus Dormibacteraeota bacterium]|nr:class I adenylate-forming enzyme family protein [Candidatus Dormibacteraeota bacterium]